MTRQSPARRFVLARHHRLWLVMVACQSLAFFPAFGQGEEAKAALTRLATLSGDPRFRSAYAAESAGLASIDDAAWLAGALAAAAKSPADKKMLLLEFASLLELLGRYSEAAGAWESASTAVLGVADAACLLSAAACRLAAGEAEAAAGLATAVAFSSPDRTTAKLAAVVSGWASLARGDRSAAADAASSLASDPEPRVALPALLLGKASADDAERAEYEKRLASYTARPEATSAVPLLLIIGSTAAGSALPVLPEKPASTSPGTGSAAAARAETQETYFQVGAFRDEANAKAMASKLESLSLRPILKVRSPGNLFVVYVGSGQEPDKTVLILKDAGYEAWAVDALP